LARGRGFRRGRCARTPQTRKTAEALRNKLALAQELIALRGDFLRVVCPRGWSPLAWTEPSTHDGAFVTPPPPRGRRGRRPKSNGRPRTRPPGAF